MTAALGSGRQHLLLAPEHPSARARRRRLYAELAELGWERQAAAFAVPFSERDARWCGIRIREQVDLGGRCQARTPRGAREMSLRTVGTDFTLVSGERLRRGGLDQLVYSVGYAMNGDETVPDVLLADGWARVRTADFDAILATAGRWFTEVRSEIVEPLPTLRRMRCCAWGLRDAQ